MCSSPDAMPYVLYDTFSCHHAGLYSLIRFIYLLAFQATYQELALGIPLLPPPYSQGLGNLECVFNPNSNPEISFAEDAYSRHTN